MRAIEAFEVVARTASTGEFIQAHPAPVFVYCGRSDGAQLSGAQGFKTQLVKSNFAATLRADVVGASGVQDSAVFEAVKLPDAAYPDHIGIGRTRVTDICLPLPQVSKLHAYLTWNEGRTTFFLTDASTTNGTVVDGKRLTAQVATALADGSTMAFGPYAFKFFLPTGFYLFLQARAKAILPGIPPVR